MLIGITAGLAAGALWGLTFVAPRLVDPFTPFDLAVLRYLVFGLISLPVVWLGWQRFARLGRADLWTVFLLGFAGYIGYYFAIAYAVTLAGAAIPALVIGALPVALAIAGNYRDRAVRWRVLALPLALIALGLAVVNLGSWQAPPPDRTTADLLAGLILSFAGLLLWLWYALANAALVRRHPEVESTGWTAMQGVGTLCGILLVMPFGWLLGWSGWPANGLFEPGAGPLWFWSVGTGVLSSWIAMWAWIIASKRLSVALSAQLIVSETMFALIYGFAVEARWPAPHEWAGAALLFTGVVVGVYALTRPTPPVRAGGEPVRSPV